MDLKRIAKATTKTLISYFTYEAMRVVVAQLSETNPPLALWLQSFSAGGKMQDGNAYIQELLQANQELAFRIMTVRQHIADEVADFLPEMTKAGIQEENMKLRCQHLEKIVNSSEIAEPETALTEVSSENAEIAEPETSSVEVALEGADPEAAVPETTVEENSEAE